MKQFIWAALAVMVLAGCGKAELNIQEELTIKEGRHGAKPYRLTWDDSRYFFYEWVLDSSMEYDLGNSDQCDWNKLTLHSFHRYTNFENSIMVSWRWDLSGFMYFAPYYHSGGETYWADVPCTYYSSSETGVDEGGLPYIKADIGDTIETHFNIDYEMDYASVTIINASTGETAFFDHTFPHDLQNQREGNPWFGGTTDCPHLMFFYRTLRARE